jgi:hypothetical protein
MFDTYEFDHAGEETTGFGGTADEPTVEPVDYDEDGTVDGVVYIEPTGEALVLIDTDRDAAADLLGIDVDGDEQLDIQVARDGDSYVVWADDNQDGEVSRGEQVVMTREELEEVLPGAADLLDQQIDDVIEPV